VAAQGGLGGFEQPFTDVASHRSRADSQLSRQLARGHKPPLHHGATVAVDSVVFLSADSFDTLFAIKSFGLFVSFWSVGMTGDSRSLAVMLRCLEWELDEAAFEISAGRYGPQQRQDLAIKMTRLARVLSEDTASAVVIEHEQ
jgi:hypothetical protein